MELLEFWKLKHKPFELSKDSHFFFESKGHGEALARLGYLVEDKNMNIGMLTGEIGCGKTLTRSVLAKQADKSEYKIATLDFSSFPFEDILREVIAQITNTKPDIDKSKYELVGMLKEIVFAEMSFHNTHIVIILDEAQQISEECLDELKNLTNIATEKSSCLTIILVGQPELRERIKKFAQVNQRVSLRYHLNPLEPEEVSQYIEHRLRKGGVEDSIFTAQAIDLIARESGGVPRNINKLCKLSMDRAFALEVREVDDVIVGTITRDFRQQEG